MQEHNAEEEDNVEDEDNAEDDIQTNRDIIRLETVGDFVYCANVACAPMAGLKHSSSL